MKSYTEYLTFNLPARMAFENITPKVDEIVRASGVREGLGKERGASLVFWGSPP